MRTISKSSLRLPLATRAPSRRSGARTASLLSLVFLATVACSVDTSNLPAAELRSLDGSADLPVDRGWSKSDSRDTAGQTRKSDGAGDDIALVRADSSSGTGGAGGGPTRDMGNDSSGGASGSGGVSGKGGSSGSGGAKGTGGIIGTGGAGTGGTITGVGGVLGTGGSSANGGSGGAPGSGGTTGTGIESDLVLHYKFDEGSGKALDDSSTSASGAHDGTLATLGPGAATGFSIDRQVGPFGLRLTPSTNPQTPGGGYVVLPSLQTLAPQAITITVWINLRVATADQDWERVFDFGSGLNGAPTFYLTARAGSGIAPVRVVMSPQGNGQTRKQRIDSSYGLNANEWHHIAVVLPAGSTYTGTLYIDGQPAGTNSNMTMHMADMGATTNNWLGRSQNPADPFFDGLMDDFRVYKRALSAAEIGALMVLH